MLKRFSSLVVVFALLLGACSANAESETTTTTLVEPAFNSTTTTTTPNVLAWDTERVGEATVYFETTVPENLRSTFRLVIGLARQMGERAGFVFDPDIYIAATSDRVFRLQTEVLGMTSEESLRKTNGARGFALYKENTVVLNLPVMQRSAGASPEEMSAEIAHVTLHEYYHLMQERLSGGAQATHIRIALPNWLIEASADFGAHLELRRYFCAQDHGAPCSDAQLLPYLRDLAERQLAQRNMASPTFVFWVEATGRMDAVDEFFRLLGTHLARNPNALPLAAYVDFTTRLSDRAYLQNLANALGEHLGRQPTDDEFHEAFMEAVLGTYLGPDLTLAEYQRAFEAPWRMTLEALLGMPYAEIAKQQEAYYAQLAGPQS
jgi:hypothetical protein